MGQYKKQFDMLILLTPVAFTGDHVGAIERSEKEGQRDIIRAQRLPSKANESTVPSDVLYLNPDNVTGWDERQKIICSNNKNWLRQQYETMGIKVIDDYDDLFLDVKLPQGWHIEATSHHMWNELFDDQERKRARFFYKASCYDEDAFIEIGKRYHYSIEPFDNYKTNASFTDRMAGLWYGVIYDCGKEIFRTPGVYKEEKSLAALDIYCDDYLTANFPDWKNIHAYWDNDQDIVEESEESAACQN